MCSLPVGIFDALFFPFLGIPENHWSQGIPFKAPLLKGEKRREDER